ncbi:Phosphatidic acid phosphohydrolase 1 [Nakaseomyces glabratus]|nr:Phosphatidic acid phosphohydrolase 1 [Nakaseomyces glabratus]KTB20547.1 Phosphatidic acid phosphohydrolase 1 [Nakaseomyces glabratus]KTB24561.1 Phosphatidic acid phosphohydrolase 1 [Nakaseomyces glabratus]
MQYVGRAFGSVSKTWSSINPATLSGAIDVIVVEHPDGTLACSPFHVRFGKFQILKPSQKKVEVLVNGKSTNVPMKLGESGEAYFVFETSANADDIPKELLDSPVISASSSPNQSPVSTSLDLNNGMEDDATQRIDSHKSTFLDSGSPVIDKLEEPDFLDINESTENFDKEDRTLNKKKTKTFQENLNRKLTEIHIPSKLENDGSLLLDIEGYKPNKEKVHDTDEQLKSILKEELGSEADISNFIQEDGKGNIKIVNPFENNKSPLMSPPQSPTMSGNTSELVMSPPSPASADSTFHASSDELDSSSQISQDDEEKNRRFIKTIRLSSDQLKCLNLVYGENDLAFSIDHGRSVITSKLFVWKWDVPIVISDIDGTITKSDALGHVLAMIGKDWTHQGVAKLFSEIARNGYNIMYLTARSAGQADSTRNYLRSIIQSGHRLPAGPVILSPDRTMAALRREVILKKPEIFKIACLNDIRSLYFDNIDFHTARESQKLEDAGGTNEKISDAIDKGHTLTFSATNTDDEKPTPFFAGFGNRITDALSYRTVGIPSSRIFTINTEGEVHMELLELAGYKSSYIHINELVDHFFPPVLLNADDDMRSISSFTPGSPVSGTVDGKMGNISFQSNGPDDASKPYFRSTQEEKFTDVNYWRDTLLSTDDLPDLSSDDNLDDVNDTKAAATSTENETPNKGKKNNADQKLMSQQGDKIATTTNGTNISKKGPVDTEKSGHSNKTHVSPESKEIGKRIYLHLGSPLTSPVKTYPGESILEEMSALTKRASSPSSSVTKLNVLDDAHDEYNHDSELSDDNNEEDEFDEDDFE